MSRAEDYAAGRAEGERWAAADLANGLPTDWQISDLRAGVSRDYLDWPSRATRIGWARGYRSIIERFHAGTLTRSEL